MHGTIHEVINSMGIPIHITLIGVRAVEAKQLVSKLQILFNTYDERFSRFKEASELSKLNASNGNWVEVSLPMFQVIKKCVKLSKETSGAFDPSVGSILASFGYGLPRSYSLPSPLPTYKEIEFNERELSIRLAPHQILEPASVVKGMAIDDAGKFLRDSKVSGYLINAGGDIITHGAYEDNTKWNVAIQDPRNGDAIVGVVAIRDLGMATSGTYQTKGTHNDVPWHHIIDMKSGEPTNNIVSATVIASTCEEADIEASLALLFDTEGAITRLDQKGLPYFLITKDNIVHKNTAFSNMEIPLKTLIQK